MQRIRTLVPLFNQVCLRFSPHYVCNVTLSNSLHTTLTDSPEVPQKEFSSFSRSKETKIVSEDIVEPSKCAVELDGNTVQAANVHENLLRNSDVKDLGVFAKITKSIDVTGLKPKLPSKSYTLVPYINESDTLSRLVNMGINLTKTEQDSDLGNFLLRADFESDIQPVLLLLMRDIGLNEDDMVKVLSSNLGLFKEHMDDIEARVNFLRYMKFSNKAIKTIVTRNANFLSYPTKDVDRACGFVQQLLLLSGNETRALLTAYPSKKLIYGDFTQTQALVDMLKDIEGFSTGQIKKMCLKYPRILTYGHSQIAKGMDYIEDVMKYARAEVVACPYVFNPRAARIVRMRHQFLQFLARDQFDPKKPNYVSLESLVNLDDEEFCENVAKTSVQDFCNFEKTL